MSVLLNATARASSTGSGRAGDSHAPGEATAGPGAGRGRMPEEGNKIDCLFALRGAHAPSNGDRMRLYIAEKPELARAIVEALGGGARRNGFLRSGWIG